MKKAFSLIEVLMVVAVITILVLAALFAVRLQMAKARDAGRKADMHKIQEAVEEYEKDHDCYPPADLMVCKPADTGLVPYLAKIPCDPLSGESYEYEPSGPVCASWYRIFAILEYEKDKDLRSRIGAGSIYNFYLSSPNAPIPVSASLPTPTPEPASAPDNFYGCKSGVCTAVSWDPSRPGPECDPNYQNPSCYGVCGSPANECVSWK